MDHYPTIKDGDPHALGEATAQVADILGYIGALALACMGGGGDERPRKRFLEIAMKRVEKAILRIEEDKQKAKRASAH